MQTPHLPRAIFGDDFQNVYEPAEDTFILLDALENDLETLKSKTSVCLECGSGSGTVITALSKALNSGNTGSNDADASNISCLMIATDINAEACKTTTKCTIFHKQNNVQVVRTNLAESLVDRLQNLVDLLVFNPPYVPTDEREEVSSRDLQLAWAGGASGRKLIDTFLNSYVPRLLSKPDGVAYMVALDKNDVACLSGFLVNEHKIQGTVVLERRAGIESLYVVKYEWIK